MKEHPTPWRVEWTSKGESITLHCVPDRITLTQGAMLNLTNVIEECLSTKLAAAEARIAELEYLEAAQAWRPVSGGSEDNGVEIRATVKVLTARMERMAKELHRKLEHLAPTGDPNWDDLEEHERGFYRTCIETLIVDLATEARPLPDPPAEEPTR